MGLYALHPAENGPERGRDKATGRALIVFYGLCYRSGPSFSHLFCQQGGLWYLSCPFICLFASYLMPWPSFFSFFFISMVVLLVLFEFDLCICHPNSRAAVCFLFFDHHICCAVSFFWSTLSSFLCCFNWSKPRIDWYWPLANINQSSLCSLDINPSLRS